ncbi:helix-turn-helix transcriptional regulator [bacterium]|nr:helix-turn-helix transcriptional regulator [bacterium]
MKLDKEIIGKKIRQIRIEKGFSQEQLSEKIDISPRHMCTIENGNSFPSLETFVNICEILDIDINKFFNIKTVKTDKLRSEIYDLIQMSSPNELHLIKDIIIAVRNNR